MSQDGKQNRYVQPGVDCGCVYTYTHTIKYVRITDCECILPQITNLNRGHVTCWDSYFAPNHPTSIPSIPQRQFDPHDILHPADLGLPANDLQLVLINPIEPQRSWSLTPGKPEGFWSPAARAALTAETPLIQGHTIQFGHGQQHLCVAVH